MAKALWSGAISFGLVTIPVEMFSVVQEKKVRFHLMNPQGNCRLRRKLYCPETKKEYDFAETALGYEVAPDQYLILDRDELDKLQPESGRTIDIEQFTDLDAIDPIYFNQPYYLMPGKQGDKPYNLLVSALQESNKVAVGKFIMREREYLATIRVANGVLVLETMHYADEIRPLNISELPKAKITKSELSLALDLIGKQSTKFDAKKYKDEYREKLQKLLKAKSQGKKITKTEEKPAKSGKVIDLMEALQASIKSKSREGAKSKSTPHSPRHKKAASR